MTPPIKRSNIKAGVVVNDLLGFFAITITYNFTLEEFKYGNKKRSNVLLTPFKVNLFLGFRSSSSSSSVGLIRRGIQISI
jgi:hypothetical protein